MNKTNIALNRLEYKLIRDHSLYLKKYIFSLSKRILIKHNFLRILGVSITIIFVNNNSYLLFTANTTNFRITTKIMQTTTNLTDYYLSSGSLNSSFAYIYSTTRNIVREI